MNKIKLHIFISGYVQGVLFRHFTKRQALEYGVKGWVKNLQDGRVEAVFEGDEESVKKILEWSKIGPIGADVKNVEVKVEEYKGEYDSFHVNY